MIMFKIGPILTVYGVNFKIPQFVGLKTTILSNCITFYGDICQQMVPVQTNLKGSMIKNVEGSQ